MRTRKSMMAIHGGSTEMSFFDHHPPQVNPPCSEHPEFCDFYENIDFLVTHVKWNPIKDVGSDSPRERSRFVELFLAEKR